MGKIIEINGEYYVDFYGNGLRFRKKAGRSLDEAQAKLREIETSLAVTAPEVPPGTATCGLFFERFAAYAREAHHPRTAARFLAAARHARTFLESALPAPHYVRLITPAVMEEYRQQLRTRHADRPVLINFTLYLLREMFEHALALGWLNDNPLRHIPNLPEPARPVPRLYTESELYHLRETLNPDEDRTLAMTLYGGLMPGEIHALQWSDVDWEQRELAVSGRCGEAVTVRRVPLDFRLFEMLAGMRPGSAESGPVFPDFCWPSSVNVYRLRNTFIREVLARGVTLTRLNRLLGVADVARVFRYRIFLPVT